MDNKSFEIVDNVEQAHDGVLWKIHQILFVIEAFIAICTEAAAIFIIFRFGRLKTVPNVYFANYLIADCIYNLSVAVFFFYILNNGFSTKYTCIHVHFELGFYTLTILFLCLVVIDWLLAVYFNRFLKLFRKFYKFILGILWIITIVYCEVSGMLCLTVTDSFSTHLLTFMVTVFLLFTVFVAAVQICRVVTKSTPRDHPHVLITLTTIFVLFHLPGTVSYLIYEITGDSSGPLSFAIVHLTVLYSISNLFLLYFLHSDFKACARQLLGRVNEEVMAEELRDEDEEADKPDERNGTGEPHRVSFHESNEELIIVE